MVHTPFEPSWRKHEAALHGNDAKESIKAGEAFTKEREKEMAFSKQARDWEKSRKERLAKDKPQWVKQQIEKEKLEDPIEQLKRELKTAGVFEWGVIPTEGWVVIEVKTLENMTKAGIYLPDGSDEGMENTGEVTAYGMGALHYSGIRVPCPAEVGDLVLFKKGAGMDIILKGKKLRYMRFDDILGVFEK